MINKLALKIADSLPRLKILFYQFCLVAAITVFSSVAFELNNSWVHTQVVSFLIGHTYFFGSFILSPVSFLSLSLGDNISETSIWIVSYFLFVAWSFLVVSQITPRIVYFGINYRIFSWLYFIGNSEESSTPDFIISLAVSIIPYLLINFYIINFLFSFFAPILIDDPFAVNAFKNIFPVMEY